jgi:hypothetical protein
MLLGLRLSERADNEKENRDEKFNPHVVSILTL